MGATQGVLTAIVADTAPNDQRGKALGVFNLITGVALLVASVIAVGLWTLFAAMTFYAGAVFSALALVGLLATAQEPTPPQA